MACVQVAVGSVHKGMQGLVGGLAHGSAAEREVWTGSLIPVTSHLGQAHPSDVELQHAGCRAWGKGDAQSAKQAVREVMRQRTGMARLPFVKIAPLSAPGPSGDRQEHLDAVLQFAGAGQRRRLFRALDSLTVRWAIGDLPLSCRWLLNTQVMFLRKDAEPSCKQFDDNEWMCTGDGESMRDIPEDEVMADHPQVDVPEGHAETPPKVRPIQMGEFLHKFVARRLLALSSTDVARLMATMRQLGVGTAGGAEALAIFQQLIYDAVSRWSCQPTCEDRSG